MSRNFFPPNSGDVILKRSEGTSKSRETRGTNLHRSSRNINNGFFSWNKVGTPFPCPRPTTSLPNTSFDQSTARTAHAQHISCLRCVLYSCKPLNAGLLSRTVLFLVLPSVFVVVFLTSTVCFDTVCSFNQFCTHVKSFVILSSHHHHVTV